MPEGVRLMRSVGPATRASAELTGYERPADGVCNICKAILAKVSMVCGGKPIGRGNPQVTMSGGVSTPRLYELSQIAKCIR